MTDRQEESNASVLQIRDATIPFFQIRSDPEISANSDPIRYQRSLLLFFINVEFLYFCV